MIGRVISGFGSPERRPDDSYHSGNTMKEVVPGICKEAPTACYPKGKRKTWNRRNTTAVLAVHIVTVSAAASPSAATVTSGEKAETVCGGGVGGSMAARASRSNCTAASKTVLETGSNGGIIPPTEDAAVELDCLATQGAQKFTTIGGKHFNRRDVGSATAYSMDRCLHSCASLNLINGRQQCVTVTFSAGLSK
ncbi:hypothetical protein MAPG_09958 [Magnaporthiopsis poae ATCC 64411]|uniref:Apple domain-containing protein n=1 Tax=Magnaporthiopsis poae (strain ATCC 64411 / 73-15) TaxID=644358 RepID=A0A0C4EBB1_MAGP6|nr:hypothetical protein MAPG_09958 [Magnaporthiopsis poae ATCC 64411]